MKRILLFVWTIIFVICSCEKKDDVKIDPKEKILGRWQIIEMGDWPVMESYYDGVYWEFLPDSNLQYFNIASGDSFTLHEKYWLNDTSLWISLPVYDTITSDQCFNYYFFQDRLRLDQKGFQPPYQQTNTTFILLKIK